MLQTRQRGILKKSLLGWTKKQKREQESKSLVRVADGKSKSQGWGWWKPSEGFGSFRAGGLVPPLSLQNSARRYFHWEPYANMRGNGHQAGQAGKTMWDRPSASTSKFLQHQSSTEKQQTFSRGFPHTFPYWVQARAQLRESRWTGIALLVWGPGSQRAGAAYGHQQQTAVQTDAKSQSQLRWGLFTRRSSRLPIP